MQYEMGSDMDIGLYRGLWDRNAGAEMFARIILRFICGTLYNFGN